MLTGNGESLADANPFRYCGYQFDKETGFYYLKYRYYIPSLGRFLTRDPMMTGNRYVYCRNNPVNFVDYLGLDETRPIIYYYARTVYVPKKTEKKPILEFRGKLGRGLEVKPKLFGVALEIGGARYMEGLTTDTPMETIEFNFNARLGKSRNIFLGATVQASRDLSTGQPIPNSQIAFVGIKIGKFQVGLGEIPLSLDLVADTGLGLLTPLGGFELDVSDNLSEVNRRWNSILNTPNNYNGNYTFPDIKH